MAKEIKVSKQFLDPKYENLIKVRDIKEVEQLFKNEKFSISFSYFQPNSIKFGNFTNYYNTNLECVFKILSMECYNTTFIDSSFKKKVHIKELKRENTIQYICQILEKGYGLNIEQLRESNFIECGISIGARFIGILRDYNVIEVLFFDPNHLICENTNFSTKTKLTYDKPCLLEKHVNTKEFNNEFNKINERVFDCRKQELLYYQNELLKDFKLGNINQKELIETSNSINEEYQDVL